MSKSYQKKYRENMSDEQNKDIEMNKNKKREKLISNIGII